MTTGNRGRVLRNAAHAAEDPKSRLAAVPEAQPSSHWVAKATKQSVSYKEGLARYVASHLIEYGMAVHAGPGTTNNVLLERIFDRQVECGEPFDLAIVTNNLTIMIIGAKRAKERPELFSTTQIIMTGGRYHESTNCLVGKFAVDAIKSARILPHMVLLGAAGVSFEGPNGALAYHFEEELDIQEAYASCRTPHRVLVCDHTKLGNSSRWQGVSIRQLLKQTPKCTIITSEPSESEPEEIKMEFRGQLHAFEELHDKLNKEHGSPLEQADLRLRVVDSSGKVVMELPDTEVST
jgi:DeoR/GlpR family transcriptional regulator of sugar metabolism